MDELYCDACGRAISDKEDIELLSWGLEDFALLCPQCWQRARQQWSPREGDQLEEFLQSGFTGFELSA